MIHSGAENPYDLVIVGGGPAGLSASINAESERLNTLVVDAADQFGGQAGTSSMIKNYPGFPEGISGPDLTARMMDQALQFDTEFFAPFRVDAIERTDEGLLVIRDNESMSVLTRTALISTGVEYRRLMIPNLAAYLGRGVTYGSPSVDESYEDKKIYVVGGANSAGQAVIHLSKFTNCDVHILIRGESIEEKMSGYLIDEIKSTPNIRIHTQTEVTAVDGDGKLRKLEIKDASSVEEVEADELFIMIGASPKTGWLSSVVERDDIGFVKAGSDINKEDRERFIENNGRPPLPHETSTPGLFVAGDVRCGTIKRVASAVGDGATVVPDLHRYIAAVSK